LRKDRRIKKPSLDAGDLNISVHDGHAKVEITIEGNSVQQLLEQLKAVLDEWLAVIDPENNIAEVANLGAVAFRDKVPMPKDEERTTFWSSANGEPERGVSCVYTWRAVRGD